MNCEIDKKYIFLENYFLVDVVWVGDDLYLLKIYEMNNKILEQINEVFKQTSRSNYKTLEQCRKDYEKELNAISQSFEITDLESLFLITIIINNTESKNCQFEDIAYKMNVSIFEVLDNIHVLFSLQSKNLIEINDFDEIPQENRRFSMRNKYTVEIMNKNFTISKETEFQIFKRIL